MELNSIGPGMIILIIIAALLLFGPSKLPELGRSFGKTLREFKNGAREVMDDVDTSSVRKEVKEVHDIAAVPQAERKEVETRRLPD